MSKAERKSGWATDAARAAYRSVGGISGLARIARQARRGAQHARSAKERKRIVKRRRNSTTYKRVRARVPRTVEQQQMVRKLQKKVDMLCLTTAPAEHTRRIARVATAQATARQAALFIYDDGGSIAEHELAMANLRYFNAATNALVVADPSVGTFKREMCISVFRKITLRNNYKVPCYVTLYSCTPKSDTSSTPAVFFASGLVDQGTGLSTTSPMMMLSDSHQLRQMWTLNGVRKLLQPGAMMKMNSWTKEFKFDFSEVDAHTPSYQKHLGGHCWAVRIEGELGHDIGVAGEVGQLKCGVDVQRNTTYKFKYDAGKDLVDFSYFDGLPAAFTNNGVLTQATYLADQQIYSI